METPDHSDAASLPLGQVKQQVEPCWLGEYQKELLIDMQTNAPTLFPKKKYILHYQRIKLYVQLGMQVEKVHRALAFNQSKWLKPYAQLNTQKRKEEKNKFEQSFKKLMVNSAFGKTCEGKRNQIKVKLARIEDKAFKWTCTPQLKSFKIIGEDLAIICLNQTEILWDKPTIVGAYFLDLSKKIMYDFHYNNMIKHFNCRLLYSDTD